MTKRKGNCRGFDVEIMMARRELLPLTTGVVWGLCMTGKKERKKQNPHLRHRLSNKRAVLMEDVIRLLGIPEHQPVIPYKPSASAKKPPRPLMSGSDIDPAFFTNQGLGNRNQTAPRTPKPGKAVRKKEFETPPGKEKHDSESPASRDVSDKLLALQKIAASSHCSGLPSLWRVFHFPLLQGRATKGATLQDVLDGRGGLSVDEIAIHLTESLRVKTTSRYFDH
jgi:hypothetical protein